jgi:hypothetical protein
MEFSHIIAIAGEFCSAGVSPAIYPILKTEKTAGKMPALRRKNNVHSNRAAESTHARD